RQLVGSEVEGLGIVALRDPVDALDAVRDERERAGLLAVAPDLDLVAVGRNRHLARDGRRRLLAAAVVRALGAVDVVEPRDARLQAVIVAVVAAEELAVQLL